jgi:hypothetical protein
MWSPNSTTFAKCCLSRYNFKSVSLSSRKIYTFKDDLRLKALGVYSIPYECGLVYKGQTGNSINTRV